METRALETLAEEIVRRITIPMEASGRHIHLSRTAVEQLFGVGYQLNRVRDLSQPGQFVCAERVTLQGPKGELKNVVVLGPERPECQAEVSLTDAVALGERPPVRLSGDLEGTGACASESVDDRTLRLEVSMEDGSAFTGVCGVRDYSDGTSTPTLLLSNGDCILSFLPE